MWRWEETVKEFFCLCLCWSEGKTSQTRSVFCALPWELRAISRDLSLIKVAALIRIEQRCVITIATKSQSLVGVCRFISRLKSELFSQSAWHSRVPLSSWVVAATEVSRVSRLQEISRGKVDLFMQVKPAICSQQRETLNFPLESLQHSFLVDFLQKEAAKESRLCIHRQRCTNFITHILDLPFIHSLISPKLELFSRL